MPAPLPTLKSAAASAPSPSASPRFESVACYLCGDREGEVFLRARDDYTGKPGEFTYLRCATCDLVYQSPRVSLEDIGAFYDDDYLAHAKRLSFGPLTPWVQHALGKHDRRKHAVVKAALPLDACSRVLDVGCARATFLLLLERTYGLAATGVDFKDMRGHPGLERIDFRQGLFYEQDFGPETFDLITLWHFLEHCYDPLRTLRTARDLLAPGGRIVIEVPNLDSRTFRWFGEHWPGVQAPQHTTLLSRASLLEFVAAAGLEVCSYESTGTFPAWFYVFMGRAFARNGGQGYDVREHLGSYFLGQLALSPVLAFADKLNLAMQTVVVRRPDAATPFGPELGADLRAADPRAAASLAPGAVEPTTGHDPASRSAT